MILLIPMHRIPLTLRALVLQPLLAVGADHARAALACGPGAESCLEASGRGALGVAGVVVLLAYAAMLGAGIAFPPIIGAVEERAMWSRFGL